ncbi:DUF5686 family protein [Larkinella insperata]|uniref:DUF5686 family protein n=1 Tax=Larkinella insperata TaxID=332158 RepID=A0ABW3QE23_9BACT|nr:DUF5686 family protein [Larkinella insperata]
MNLRLQTRPNGFRLIFTRILSALLGVVITAWAACGQTPSDARVLSGRITETPSGAAVPFAAVAVKGKPIGTQADENGQFRLAVGQRVDSLLVSAMGYQTTTVAINAASPEKPLEVVLKPVATQLNEVVIRAGENPAYRILREVAAHRSQNDFRKLDGYEYDAYSQLSISINQMAERFRRRKPVQTILRAVEKKQAGKTVTELPIFFSETVSKLYARRQPERQKEHILKTAISSAGLTDDSFITMFTGAGFNTLNFYQNTVSLFKKEFISPLADNSRAAYSYFLADTAQVGLHTCFVLDFDPKNERDLVFRGKVWIDTVSYALVQIDAQVGAAANLNFIKQIDIEQTYETAGESARAWLPETTHLTVQVGEVVKHTFGATVEYRTTVRQPLVGQPKPVGFFDTEVQIAEDRAEASADYWQAQRESAAESEANKQTRAVLDTVRNLPLIKFISRTGQFVLNGGYVPLFKGVEAGSVFSMWAYNPVEGHRLRMGLQTNNQFSRNWQLAAYSAYGTRDQIWKMGGEINYIPTHQPLTLITLKSSYDLEQLGLRTEDLADNPFLRITSRFGRYPQAYYQNETALSVQRDLGTDFIQTAGIRYRRIDPLFPFAFRQPVPDTQQTVCSSDFWSREAFLELRYAPGRIPSRRVTKRRIQRRPTETAPIVSLRYTYGTASFEGGTFGDYHKWQFQLDHTLRWGLFGRTQYTVQAGYIPSTLPYPLLQVHVGNQTPFYNRNAYNLMNFGEFVSDRYASVSLEHKFEGLFTNRLPLIRRLGWRSFVTGKLLWGGLSESNRNLIATHDAAGKALAPVYSLQHDPYVEVGYGIENIFKLVRVEGMHRLTYRQQPNVTPFAVKVSFQVGL